MERDVSTNFFAGDAERAVAVLLVKVAEVLVFILAIMEVAGDSLRPRLVIMRAAAGARGSKRAGTCTCLVRTAGTRFQTADKGGGLASIGTPSLMGTVCGPGWPSNSTSTASRE